MVCCLCYKGLILTQFCAMKVSLMLCFIATETEGVGLHGDGYSSEENDESTFHDYEGAYEVCGEQDYDCSSEESDTESESNLNFASMSKESDSVGPSTRKTSSKGKNSTINFYFYVYKNKLTVLAYNLT